MPGVSSVLIVGGYGVVGQQIAQLLRQRHPNLLIQIAGRNMGAAKQCAEGLGHAEPIALDIANPWPLKPVANRPGLVLACVNDPHDHLLTNCVRDGIPYIDITRWTERMQESLERLRGETLQAPVLFSSGWMAGSVACMIAATNRQHSPIEAIDIDVLFYLADKAGPNSFEYMDRLAQPFLSWEHNVQLLQQPLTSPKRVGFPSGKTATTYRFETPDLITLPDTLHVRTINTRIAFDSSVMMKMLVAARITGILKLLSLPVFHPLRKVIMYNPGQGAAHEIVITLVTGSQTTRITLADPMGQTHLTACGAVAQVEWIGGMSAVPAQAGVLFPEQHPDPQKFVQLLTENGVSIETQTACAAANAEAHAH